MEGTEEAINGNKIIAEFMGAKFKGESTAFGEKDLVRFPQGNIFNNENAHYEKLSDLKFHSSWDWLMPCVKKWNDLVISKRNAGGAGWTKWQYKTVMLRTEIEPVWKELIENLKWYNHTSTQ